MRKVADLLKVIRLHLLKLLVGSSSVIANVTITGTVIVDGDWLTVIDCVVSDNGRIVVEKPDDFTRVENNVPIIRP